jgi:hypothetical protein
MQTTGAALFAVNRCSPMRVRVAAHDSRRAHGLLYLAAVWTDRREQEHRQGTLDTDPSLLRYAQSIAYRRSSGLALLRLPAVVCRIHGDAAVLTSEDAARC